MPNETLVAFYNGSKYDYHFIIKGLANEFEFYLNVLWKTGKYKYIRVKYKGFSVRMK